MGKVHTSLEEMCSSLFGMMGLFFSFDGGVWSSNSRATPAQGKQIDRWL